jgi:hypothetical protein
MKFKDNGSHLASINTAKPGIVKIYTIGAQRGLVIDGNFIDRFASLEDAVRYAECKVCMVVNFGEVA